ncbi:MAG: hypothetical protein KGL18_11820 [Burkholderiales bacterium]|nr:hypothetical protein [Burkholderiales bacterium]MDE1927123.1 hypothetical protein [Burkholderiales bacterium]MDE2159255.1 hypothetical protein [Burkholderiales bacterium]MDE2503645.1 hypothetical protein [Burkholderiales bacterium]
MHNARKLQLLAVGAAVAIAAAIAAWKPAESAIDQRVPGQERAAPSLLAALSDVGRPDETPVPASVRATSMGTLLRDPPH